MPKGESDDGRPGRGRVADTGRHRLLVSPSILAADLTRLRREVEDLPDVVEWLHLDVMDGHYVPDVHLGQPLVRSLRGVSDRFLDVHLMVDEPDVQAPSFASAGADMVTFHPEVAVNAAALVDRLHEQGASVGVALRPDHPLAGIEHLLESADLVLLMTVEPGEGGRPFLEHVLTKVTEAFEWRTSHDASFRIEVDGGVDPRTAGLAVGAGADTLVSGTSIFRATDRGLAVRDLLGVADDRARGTTRE